MLKVYCNEGEDITEAGGEGAMLYFLHKKKLSEEEVLLLVDSMSWYRNHTNGFSREPKYQIKLKDRVLI